MRWQSWHLESYVDLLFVQLMPLWHKLLYGIIKGFLHITLKKPAPGKTRGPWVVTEERQAAMNALAKSIILPAGTNRPFLARRRRGSHQCARGPGRCKPVPLTRPSSGTRRMEWSPDSPTPSRPAASPQAGSASHHARGRPVRVLEKRRVRAARPRVPG